MRFVQKLKAALATIGRFLWRIALAILAGFALLVAVLSAWLGLGPKVAEKAPPPKVEAVPSPVTGPTKATVTTPRKAKPTTRYVLKCYDDRLAWFGNKVCWKEPVK